MTEGVDYAIDYSTGTIQMLNAGYNNSALTVNFEYTTNGFNGPGDNATALAVANLQNQLVMAPDSSGNNTATFTGYYGATLSQVGADSDTVSSQISAHQALLQQYQTQEDAVSGVSLDEQMSNMITFEHTYEAAANVVSVTDKMLDALVAIT